jgi:hypothetical protein
MTRKVMKKILKLKSKLDFKQFTQLRFSSTGEKSCSWLHSVYFYNQFGQIVLSI